MVLPETHYKEYDQILMKCDLDAHKIEEIKRDVLIMLVSNNIQNVYIDATTGQVLDGRLVKKARLLEMIYFKDKNVYTKVAREEAYRFTGRAPVAVKGVDVNNGDDEDPNYRSRLVAKDYKRKGDDSRFAPTPPFRVFENPSDDGYKREVLGP